MSMLSKVTTPKAIATLARCTGIPEARVTNCALKLRDDPDHLLPRGPRGRGALGIQPEHVVRLMLALLMDPDDPQTAPFNVRHFSALELHDVRKLGAPPPFEGAKFFENLDVKIATEETSGTSFEDTLGEIVRAFAEDRPFAREASLLVTPQMICIQPATPRIVLHLFGFELRFAINAYKASNYPNKLEPDWFERFRTWRVVEPRTKDLSVIYEIAQLFAPDEGGEP